MKVVDTKDHCWFLFKHDSNLHLDVNCDLSAVGYSFMIQLNNAELESYRSGGHEYLSELARVIEDSVPITIDTASIYKGRRVEHQMSELTTDAVEVWRSSF